MAPVPGGSRPRLGGAEGHVLQREVLLREFVLEVADDLNESRRLLGDGLRAHTLLPRADGRALLHQKGAPLPLLVAEGAQAGRSEAQGVAVRVIDGEGGRLRRDGRIGRDGRPIGVLGLALGRAGGRPVSIGLGHVGFPALSGNTTSQP